MRWVPNLVPPWSLSDLEGMLNDALRVLGEIGVRCMHETVRDRLAEGGGVSFVEERVRFAEDRVRAHLEGRRALASEQTDDDEVEFSMGGCWAALNYCDPETQEVRPASSGEAAQMTRFWDARGISGVVPVIPGDVPPAMVTLAAERIALEHSRFLGGLLTVTDPEEIRFLIDMDAAAGRRYLLMEQVGISPLQFDDLALEAALPFLDRPDVEVSLAGFIPMAGAACPLDPRSAVVQSVAETLAVDMLCAALGIAGGGLGLRVEPFDFQYSMIVFGSPEWCLYRVLVLQMSEYLTGRQVRGGSFRSVAKRPDAQAVCERTASVLWQALLGARHFGAVGQLSVDEVFSPQQVVLDREILGYVRRVVEGMDLTAEVTDAVELIAEGVREGSFIGVDDTVYGFRAFYDFPELFRHWNLGRWRSEGGPSILAEAWARAQQEIETSTYELEEDRRAEIEAIHRKAEQYVQNRM